MRKSLAMPVWSPGRIDVTASHMSIPGDKGSEPLGLFLPALYRNVGCDLGPAPAPGTEFGQQGDLFPPGRLEAGPGSGHLGLDGAQTVGGLPS